MSRMKGSDPLLSVEGLQVVDLSDPANPAVVGTFKTTAPARDVAVSGSLVLVASGPAEILILRRN